MVPVEEEVVVEEFALEPKSCSSLQYYGQPLVEVVVEVMEMEEEVVMKMMEVMEMTVVEKGLQVSVVRPTLDDQVVHNMHLKCEKTLLQWSVPPCVGAVPVPVA